MPISKAALNSEIMSDPLNLGYTALRNLGRDQAIADLLNATTGPGAATISLPYLPINDFLLAITPALTVLPSKDSAMQAKWDRILATVRVLQEVRLTDARVTALINLAVADGILTSAQANAIGKRTGSRAEVLGGAGTFVNHSEVAVALGRGN